MAKSSALNQLAHAIVTHAFVIKLPSNGSLAIGPLPMIRISTTGKVFATKHPMRQMTILIVVHRFGILMLIILGEVM
jgi:hypothetical protein